jgi:cytoskeletal protein CcmA (bactofilin family)
MYEYEHIMTFDQPFVLGSSTSPSASTASPSASSSSATVTKKKKSIKSEEALELRGPLEVDGSVKSMASVSFVGGGEFAVRDRVEAYGNLEVEGVLSCGGKVKSMGNVKVRGQVVCM